MRRDGIETALFLAVALVAAVGLFFVEAWLLMLLVGALHHEVSASIPAVGFGGAALLTLALTTLAGLFRSSR